MGKIQFLHPPVWQQVGSDWILIVGGRAVAALTPNVDSMFPQYRWLSRVFCECCPAYGWDVVDFEDLETAQHEIVQWWLHACRGEAYRSTGSTAD